MGSRTVLLVEDEAGIAENIRYALSTEGFSVFWETLGGNGISRAKEIKPAVVLLDIGLPDKSGYDVLRSLREFYQGPIIFLTARSEEIDRVSGLEMGADDYITKPFSPRELAARVRAVLRRGERAEKDTQSASNYGPFIVDKSKYVISYHSESLDLTRYEFRLLSLLISNPGRVFTREQLMDRVWESPEMSLERTVDTHVKTIRQKLKNIAPDENPITTHRGIGYSFEEY